MFEMYNFNNKVKNEQVEREIREQISLFDDIIYRISFSGYLNKIQSDLLGNKQFVNLYNSKDSDGLLEAYEIGINKLRKLLFNENDSQEMIIAKACEYLRLMTFKDNMVIDERTKGLENLSKSSISPLLIGKGSSLAQARLLRDLLPKKMDSIIYRINDMVKYSDKDVLVTRCDDKLYSIDVANYDGTSNSLSNNYRINYYSEEVKPLNIPNSLIINARTKVANCLIKELKIDEVSNIIINDEMSMIDKQYAIIGYISTKLVHFESNVSFNIACMNGKFIEVGKLLELFFICNNIPYNILGSVKENNIYEVDVDGEKYKLDPKEMFSSNYNTVTDYLHYKESDGNRCYLSLADEDNYKKLRIKIDRSILVGTYVNEEVFSEGNKKSLVG